MRKSFKEIICLLSVMMVFLVGCDSKQSESSSLNGGSVMSVELEGVKYTCSAEGDYYVVSGCTGLSKNITIPATCKNLPVKEIGERAFEGEEDIKSVILPDSIVKIGKYSFLNCSGLASVKFGENLETIGEAAFMNCHKLSSVTLGENVRTIGKTAFSCCIGLREITIPDSVITIESQAFSSCRNLTNISIGNSLQTIGDGAFESCNSLWHVAIPDSVTEIGECAFNDSGLTTVTIGKSVTTIKKNVFGGLCQIRSAYFINPNGWTIDLEVQLIQVASEELADEQTAGVYLRGHYRGYTWTRNTI